MTENIGTVTVEILSTGWVSIKEDRDRIVLTRGEMEKLIFLYQSWQQDQEVDK